MHDEYWAGKGIFCVDERELESDLLAFSGVSACIPILPTVTKRPVLWCGSWLNSRRRIERCGLVYHLYSKCVSCSE